MFHQCHLFLDLLSISVQKLGFACGVSFNRPPGLQTNNGGNHSWKLWSSCPGSSNAQGRRVVKMTSNTHRSQTSEHIKSDTSMLESVQITRRTCSLHLFALARRNHSVRLHAVCLRGWVCIQNDVFNSGVACHASQTPRS